MSYWNKLISKVGIFVGTPGIVGYFEQREHEKAPDRKIWDM